MNIEALVFDLYMFSNTNASHVAHFAARQRTLLSFFAALRTVRLPRSLRSLAMTESEGRSCLWTYPRRMGYYERSDVISSFALRLPRLPVRVRTQTGTLRVLAMTDT